jgi:hypothetical protein
MLPSINLTADRVQVCHDGISEFYSQLVEQHQRINALETINQGLKAKLDSTKP